MSVGFVEVGNGRMWYEEAGEGPAVLLLHAEATDSSLWDAQWAGFTERFHTIRVDLPGCGRSPYPRAAWDPGLHLERLLDALGVGRAALVGAGLGGTLAVDFAAERPKRAWALVAASLSSYATGDDMPDLRAAEVFTLLLAGRPGRAADLFLDVWCPLRSEPDVDARQRALVRENIGMLTQVSKGLLRLDGHMLDEQVRTIEVPTLVVWGDKDERAAQSASQRLATRVRHAVAMVLPDVDHFVPLRAPEIFESEVLSFLEGAAADSR